MGLSDPCTPTTAYNREEEEGGKEEGEGGEISRRRRATQKLLQWNKRREVEKKNT
jgi:hypothetical protein